MKDLSCHMCTCGYIQPVVALESGNENSADILQTNARVSFSGANKQTLIHLALQFICLRREVFRQSPTLVRSLVRDMIHHNQFTMLVFTNISLFKYIRKLFKQVYYILYDRVHVLLFVRFSVNQFNVFLICPKPNFLLYVDQWLFGLRIIQLIHLSPTDARFRDA